jgi:hypothetical protein
VFLSKRESKKLSAVAKEIADIRKKKDASAKVA